MGMYNVQLTTQRVGCLPKTNVIPVEARNTDAATERATRTARLVELEVITVHSVQAAGSNFEV